MGEDVIREDAWNTMSDCRISDVTYSDVDWVGVTILFDGILSDMEGAIQLNTYYMDDFTISKRILAIKHEFGHTLGCDENDCSEFNIMFPFVAYSNINLTIHDKASVDAAKLLW